MCGHRHQLLNVREVLAMPTIHPPYTSPKAHVVPETTIVLPHEDLTFDELVERAGLQIIDPHLINAKRIRPSLTHDPRPVEKVVLFRVDKGTPFYHIRRSMRYQGAPALGAWDLLRLLAQEPSLSNIYALDWYSRSYDAFLVLTVQGSSGARYLKSYPGNNVGHGDPEANGHELYVGLKD